MLKSKFLYLIIAVQIVANAFTLIYSTHAATDPCVQAMPASVTATPTAPAPTFPFTASEVRRYPNPNNLVVYASIHDKDGYQVAGYKLHFAKDGAAVGEVRSSTGYVQGVTHPPTIIGGNVITSSIPSFTYNLKMDFNPLLMFKDFAPTGKWTVVLQDENGKAVSMEQSFVVIDNDPTMEIFLDYAKN